MAGVALPSNEDIPNVDLEVVNFHRPVLGTFHAKFMIQDRKVGIICSNNIQVSCLQPRDTDEADDLRTTTIWR